MYKLVLFHILLVNSQISKGFIDESNGNLYKKALFDEIYRERKERMMEKEKEGQKRYLFYDVNPPEGFNLRRDVYMRFAMLAEKLTHSKNRRLNNFTLVLPPWSSLYHWKSGKQPEFIPWGLFFDIESLQKFAPVIEMHQFFTEIKDSTVSNNRKIKFEKVYVLQHSKDMFETGKFKDIVSFDECNDENYANPSYFYYQNISADNVFCISFHGSVYRLMGLLKLSVSQTTFFDHGEVVLHEDFGGETYWRCRRSMRFNKELVQIAADFRKTFLNSDDIRDNTERPDDWRQEIKKRDAVGGPYLGVHLRRRDFVWGRPKKVPSIESTARQIKERANEEDLEVVFVATDGTEKEYEELREILSWDNIKAIKFNPNKEIKKKFKDGGIAIIDQIICSHARFFMGTYESTFSFRIQEEREIIGFPSRTTFNRFCGDKEGEKCSKPSIWKIVHNEL